MSQVQINKLYIRQRVPQPQQAAFYQYFTQLPDFTQFDNWTHQRTIQIVRNFQESRVNSREKTASETIKVPIFPSHPLQNLTNNVDIKKFQTHQGSFKTLQSKPKNISAISFLEEIEQKMIFTPRKQALRPIDEQKNKSMFLKNSPGSQAKNVESIPNKSEQTTDKPNSAHNEKQNSKEQQPPKQKISLKPNQTLPKSEQKFQLKRSFELKRQKSELKHSLELRQKKSSNSDKLFRWKLSQQITCRKLTTKLELERISITNHEMVHRYFLPDYVIYHILVFPTKIVCKRTYDEFLDLRKNLEKMFPCIKIPYLDSSSWFSESDIALINKNKVNLELFLNQLIRHPTLSKTEIAKDFLTIPDFKAIETALNNYSELPQISKLSQLANQIGSIKVALSEQNTKLIGQLPTWQKHFQGYFDKYIDLVSNLTSQYESIQLIFSQLVNLNYDFRLKMSQMPEIRSILGDYGQFQNLIQRKQKFFNEKKKQVQKDIENLKDKYILNLIYQKLNVNSLESIVQPVQKLTKKYIERLENEPESPSSGQQTQNIKQVKDQKFSQTIWQESENINLFKYQVGYLNNRLIQELNIFNNRLVENLTDIWEQVFDNVKLGSQKFIL